MVKRYQSKIVEIEAVQWLGYNWNEVSEFTGEDAYLDGGYLYIYTLEGTMKATEGDFIIKGLRGEFYPCKPDVFRAKYQDIWGEGPGLQWKDNFIAVDIDGTIASSNEGLPKYPQDYMKKKAIAGSIDALRQLQRLGFKVMLFTARPEKDREWTEAWLVANGFTNLYHQLVMDKPGFQVLIDDRAIQFKGDWKKTMDDVKRRLVVTEG